LSSHWRTYPMNANRRISSNIIVIMWGNKNKLSFWMVLCGFNKKSNADTSIDNIHKHIKFIHCTERTFHCLPERKQQRHRTIGAFASGKRFRIACSFLLFRNSSYLIKFNRNRELLFLIVETEISKPSETRIA